MPLLGGCLGPDVMIIGPRRGGGGKANRYTTIFFVSCGGGRLACFGGCFWLLFRPSKYSEHTRPRTKSKIRRINLVICFMPAVGFEPLALGCPS